MKKNMKRFSLRWWLTFPNRLRSAWKRLNPRDPTLLAMTYWGFGELDRIPIEVYFRNAAEVSLTIVRPGCRTPGTSITAHELFCIAMSVHAVNARNIIEIGTFDGNTSLNFASNLPEDGQVVTIDLPVNLSEHVAFALETDPSLRNVTPRNMVGSQFQGHPLARKIRQVYGDTAKLNFSEIGGFFDIAFIDGCHAYEYVVSDTKNIIPIMRPGGLLIWHDYCNHEGVARAVDELKDDPRFESIYAIEESRLAMAILKSVTK